MANMHLVTGYGGEEHVTADDQASFHVRMLGETLGSGQYVLNIGNKLSASIVTNNQVRVLDGEILMQGRYIRIPAETYVDLDIENGAQSVQRNDLIVARYTKDVVTGVEAVNLVVIKGESAESNPSDPAYIVGDLLNDHALQADMPLYRLFINGLTAETLTPLFTLYDSTVDELKATDAKKQERTDLLTLASTIKNDDQIPIFEASGSKHKKVKFKTINDLLASYSKDEVLSAATKTMFGLGADAVPDDAFSFLGRLNQYCWKRRSKTATYDASIGTAKNVALVTGYNASRTIEYASSYSVGDDGTVTLNNPSVTAAIGYRQAVSNATPLKGNYFFDCYYDSNYSKTEGLFYVAPNAANASTSQNFNGTSDLYAVTMYVSKVTLTQNESLGEWEYIFSNDRNAYPDSGIADGAEYVFLGKPLENAISAVKIETGSYAGAGLYGSSNPNKLTFQSTPKFVVVQDVSDSPSVFMIFLINGVKRAFPTTVTALGYAQYVTWNGNEVSWYGNGSDYQMNQSGHTYNYIMIP